MFNSTVGIQSVLTYELVGKFAFKEFNLMGLLCNSESENRLLT